MRPSLRRRLLALTTTVIVVVVGLVALVVWWGMDRSLRRDLDETLRTQAIALAGRLENEDGRLEFDLDPGILATADIRGDVLVQIIGPHGAVLFTSPELVHCREFGDRIAHSADRRPVEWFNADLPPHAQQYRVVALRTVASASEEVPGVAADAEARNAWVYVARSCELLNQTMHRLAWALVAAVVLAVFAAGVGGYYIAASGIRPIRDVADVIAKVEPGRPRLAIDRRRLPAELDPIVSTTDGLLDRIEQELRRRQQLTADVAHDLRTPVAGVRTLLDVCAQQERTPAEYIETIATARVALRQLSLLLDDVLTMARFDGEAEHPVMSDIALSKVISDAMEVVRPLAAGRQVEFEVVGVTDVTIRSNAFRLCKILTNVLANAVEYSPAESKVHVTAQNDAQCLAIHIRDCGPGVPASRRESIFERFVRGDAARVGSAGHSGLGLAIARGLARTLGGNISLDTQWSAGSDFVVTLPLNGDTRGQ